MPAVDARVGGHEATPEGRKPEDSVGDGGADLQRTDRLATALADLGLGLLDFLQQALAAGEEEFSFGSQREPAGGAVQEAHAQAGLQFRHAFV